MSGDDQGFVPRWASPKRESARATPDSALEAA
jgi:hypothetical protein